MGGDEETHRQILGGAKGAQQKKKEARGVKDTTKMWPTKSTKQTS